MIDLLLIAVGAFLGALVLGSTGLAFAIVASVFWAHAFEPVQVVVLSASCAAILHVFGVWRIRRDIRFHRLFPLVAGSLVGVPIGVALLGRVDVAMFRSMLGVLMIIYAVFEIFSSRLKALNLFGKPAIAADLSVGFVSGIVGGMTMLHGILPVIWTSMRGWKKQEARCVYQPYLMVTALYVLGVIAVRNIEIDGWLTDRLFMVPPAIVLGYWCGMFIYANLNERKFSMIIKMFIFVSGVSLLLR